MFADEMVMKNYHEGGERYVYHLRDISRSAIGETVCKGELTYSNCLYAATGAVEEQNSGTRGAWSNKV
jgi:hypothetical protein